MQMKIYSGHSSSVEISHPISPKVVSAGYILATRLDEDHVELTDQNFVMFFDFLCYLALRAPPRCRLDTLSEIAVSRRARVGNCTKRHLHKMLVSETAASNRRGLEMS